jgi:hypothetical protein
MDSPARWKRSPGAVAAEPCGECVAWSGVNYARAEWAPGREEWEGG